MFLNSVARLDDNIMYLCFSQVSYINMVCVWGGEDLITTIVLIAQVRVK